MISFRLSTNPFGAKKKTTSDLQTVVSALECSVTTSSYGLDFGTECRRRHEIDDAESC